ncbi:hypothetical protein I5M32_05390 [Pedobacter sp. SD-b]|uniref:Uncharacterized protein n=1 Tax=Pedobacter segetis TaxID=2793069 RepID=A0ABS1BHP7_9SPHI|nr:hypothetical protein [Pedobacter segetis]MBK0382390.1 hypothetical protein [Pedobacter segetis]
METFTVELINPKAKKLLQDLADMNLITISKSKKSLDNLLNTLRSNETPSIEEITKEVEKARTKRHESKTANSYN